MKTALFQETWSASRRFSISLWRTWNTCLDALFYDTEALSAQEQVDLSNHLEPEGLILVVYPQAAQQPIRPLTALQFVQAQRGHPAEPVSTLVVAGVGRSALGTACLARDVANYLKRPVAGIVSGLGMADVTTEALGGWCVLGATHALRDLLARSLQPLARDPVREQRTHEAIKKHFHRKGLDPERFLYGSPDSTVLLYLLSTLGPKIKLLVGHSQGNLAIEKALEGWHQMAQAANEKVAGDLRIVTLSGVICFPPEFTNVQQLMGQMDLFGLCNSRLDLSCVLIPGAWHTLNPLLPGSLSVKKALQLAGVSPGGGKVPKGPMARVPVHARLGAAALDLSGRRWPARLGISSLNGNERQPGKTRRKPARVRSRLAPASQPASN